VKKDASELVNEYADSIIMSRKLIGSGNVKQIRYYDRKRTPIAKQLLRMGDEGIREFAALLSHPDWEIRADAACSLISSLPEEALAVFREMAESDNPLVAIAGKMRIKEWEEHPEHYDPKNWAR
jgi:hypothetical protein